MRTAEFDTEFVLRQAMHAFMQYGYAKTSMQKLKEVTHLHPGSIYAAYGNKKGLFLAATEQYQKDRNQQFTALFNDQQSILSTLKHYLTVIVDECIEGEVAKVCLLTKSISEVEGNDPQICTVLRGNLNAYEHALAEQLQKAGYNQVYNLYGGIFEWKNADYTVFDDNGETNNVHGFSKEWSKWLKKGDCVYE